ncbi:MAG TPA: hypothetical protein VF444_16665 [Pseudonocardiaceae bacterium]
MSEDTENQPDAPTANQIVGDIEGATVLGRRPPRPTENSWMALGVLPVRSFTVDLDPEDPRVVAEATDFPFTVTASDPEMFAIRPLSTVDEVRWQLELDWTYAGRRGTTVIPENGRGFLLYPDRQDTR